MFKRRLQKGFATLEVILMVMVIGILASIAIPRFSSVTTAANTAKIQSDLATIDTAIAIHNMEKGTAISSVNDLSDYLQDAANIKPPVGKTYAKRSDTVTELTITDSDVYEFQEIDGELRAVLKGYTSGEFTTKKSDT